MLMSNRASRMKFTLCGKVGLMSKLRREINAKACLFSVNAHLGQPFPVFFTDTKKSGFIIDAWFPYILTIPGIRNISEIDKFIVRFVAVFVVNLLRRPASMYVQPSQPMTVVQRVVQTKDDVTMTIAASSNIAYIHVPRSLNDPSEDPGIWVVVQQLLETFVRQCRNFGSHTVSPLKKWACQSPDRVDSAGGLHYYSIGGI